MSRGNKNAQRKGFTSEAVGPRNVDDNAFFNTGALLGSSVPTLRNVLEKSLAWVRKIMLRAVHRDFEPRLLPLIFVTSFGYWFTQVTFWRAFCACGTQDKFKCHVL